MSRDLVVVHQLPIKEDVCYTAPAPLHRSPAGRVVDPGGGLPDPTLRGEGRYQDLG